MACPDCGVTHVYRVCPSARPFTLPTMTRFENARVFVGRLLNGDEDAMKILVREGRERVAAPTLDVRHPPSHEPDRFPPLS